MTALICGGIDLGGTKIEARLFDGPEASTTELRRIPTPRESYAAMLEALEEQIRWLAEKAERADLRRTLGVADGAALPPAVRSQVTALEDEQKRRATRSLRDGIDRVLTDLQSMYRDVVMLAFEREADMINRELESELRALAQTWGPRRALVVLDRIAETRRNLEQNVNPTLALESLLVTVASGRTP